MSKLKALPIPHLYLSCNLLLTTDTILTIVDIQRVRIALLPAHTKWFDIGLTLDVDHETLCSIRREYSNDGDRLREMLSCRLKSGGNLTWTVLCAGLREPTVGRNDVANAIEKKLEGECTCNFLNNMLL